MSRLRLIRGDAVGAASFLAQADKNERQNDFTVRLPSIAATLALNHLNNGNVDAASQIAQQYDLPLIRAQVLLAQGNPATALALLVPYRQQMEEKHWEDALLQVIVLQALALHMLGDKDPAFRVLIEALTLAEPGGFIRTFIDKGEPMRQLIGDFRLWLGKQPGDRNLVLSNYVEKILAAYAPSEAKLGSSTKIQQSGLVEPLSERELEVLRLVCQGLSNQEICQRLFLALDTVKGHNRRIFDKLLVHTRTEAIARARELSLF
jgi:LuxR family maltose regulon positive regulatory protein